MKRFSASNTQAPLNTVVCIFVTTSIASKQCMKA